MNAQHLLDLAVFATIVIAIVGFAGCSESSSTAFSIDGSSVSAISASISYHPEQLTDPSLNIDEFEVPKSCHDEILGLIQGAARHQSEIDWAVLGQLKITTGDGVQSVNLYSAGDKFIFDIPSGSSLTSGMYEANGLKDLIRAISNAKGVNEGERK